MNQSSWRDRSQALVSQKLLEYEAQQLLIDEPIDYQDALTQMSRHEYPFSWKGGWAYTSWLKAIRWTKARCAEGWDATDVVRTDWRWWERSKYSTPLAK